MTGTVTVNKLYRATDSSLSIVYSFQLLFLFFQPTLCEGSSFNRARAHNMSLLCARRAMRLDAGFQAMQHIASHLR